MCGEAFSPRYQATGRPPTANAHDASRLTESQKDAFINAYFNNDADEVERLRGILAPASLPKTRAEAAEAVAEYISDVFPFEYLGATNSDSDGCVRAIDDDFIAELQALATAYDRAR